MAMPCDFTMWVSSFILSIYGESTEFKSNLNSQRLCGCGIEANTDFKDESEGEN